MNPEKNVGLRRFCGLQECADATEVASALSEAAQRIGFDRVQLMVVMLERKPMPLRPIRVTSSVLETDRAIVMGHLLGPNLPAYDPVAMAVRRSVLPVVWGREIYVGAGMEEFYETQLSRLGEGFGVAMRLSLPTASFSAPVHVVLTTQRCDAIPLQVEDRYVSDLAQLSMYCMDAADRLLLPQLERVRVSVSPLRPSEAQYLAWAAQGYSVKETARIVGRSPATIQNGLQRAIDALDATDKRQAMRLCKERGWLPTVQPPHELT